MPWFGVILWRWSLRNHGTECRHWRREYCVEFDRKRKNYELRKGGAQVQGRGPRHIRVPTENGMRTVQVYDSSPFATARWELWEETGVWVGWRAEGTYTWISTWGRVLPGGPGANQNAWLCTELSNNDDSYDARRPPKWMNLDEFEVLSSRTDHYRVLASIHQMEARPSLHQMEARPSLAGQPSPGRRRRGGSGGGLCRRGIDRQGGCGG